MMLKRKLIPYAGFDPMERHSKRPIAYNKIDVARAEALKAKGLTWKEVGKQLAEEQGRDAPYSSDSVHGAVARERSRRIRAMRNGK
jgi:hypothetical protein